MAETNDTDALTLTLLRDLHHVDPPGPGAVARQRGLLDVLIAEERAARCRPERPRRTRRGRWLLAGAVGTAALLGGAAAATGVFARTGRVGPGGELGTGELIRTDAADAADVVAEIGAAIPLPPGGTWGALTEDLPSDPTVESSLGLRSTLEFHAACQWTGYWLEAEASGDRGASREALAVLRQVPTWPALNETDGGGTIALWTDIAAAAGRGDPDAVRDGGYTANCS